MRQNDIFKKKFNHPRWATSIICGFLLLGSLGSTDPPPKRSRPYVRMSGCCDTRYWDRYDNNSGTGTGSRQTAVEVHTLQRLYAIYV